MNYKEIEQTIATLDDEKKEIANALLDKLKFMEKTLKKLQKEVDDNGVVVEMCQGNYSIRRSNPALTTFNTTMKNYVNVQKELQELLPKDIVKEDDFDAFGSDAK